MSTLRLVCQEILHRRWSALLTAVAVAAGVALVLFLTVVTAASEKRTRGIQRDIGLNVIILPEGAQIDAYWRDGHATGVMPAAYIDRVVEQGVANRLIPMLKQRLRWGEAEVMLTGIAGERFIPGAPSKPVFGLDVEPGTLVLGAVAASRTGSAEGETVTLLDRSFEIARVLAPTGSAEDVCVYAALTDVQRVLDLGEVINEIQAIECHCDESVADPLARLQAELEPLLPGTQVVRRERAADARLDQRHLAERVMRITAPIIVALSGLIIAALAMLNVRERREEIGVLRALGFGSPRVATLVLGRVVTLGLLGAAFGCAAAFVLSKTAAPAIFTGGPKAIELTTSSMLWALAIAPAFAAVACLVPVTVAVTTDPAIALREE